MLNVVNYTVVTMFLKLYIETSDPRRFTLYRPQCPPGYCSLGDYAQRSEKGAADHSNNGVALCLKVTNDSKLVSFAEGYTQIWSSERLQRGVVPQGESDDEDTAGESGFSGSGHVETLAFWKPSGPGDDYVAVGHVATTTFARPPLSAVCVVHKSIAVPVASGKRVWTDHSGAASLWSADQGYGHLNLQTFFSSDTKSASLQSEFWSLTANVIPAPEGKLVTKKIRKDHLALIHQERGGEPFSVYAPRGPAGYAPLGHYAEGAASKGKARRVMVVREKNGSGLMMHPRKYKQIWSKHNTEENSTVAFWRPIPSPGYFCLGDVLSAGLEAPDANAVVCLHWSVLCRGRRGARVWSHQKTPTSHRRWSVVDATVWRVSPFSEACKTANTFVVTRGPKEPPSYGNMFHCVQRNGIRYKW